MKNKRLSDLLKFLLLHFIFTVSLVSCQNQKENSEQSKSNTIKAGSICLVENGGGTFSVVKVLVLDESIAHIRIYKNKYQSRPKKVDLNTLTLGSLKDPDGFGIGHTPLDRNGFENWKPLVVGFKPVTEEELEGYHIWQDQ